MRLQALAVLLLASIALLPTSSGHQDGGDLVNAVLGNSSQTFSSEQARIRAHLEAVAERLARVDDSSLAPALRDARQRNLDRLRAYARAGAFPRKPANMPGRIPNFLDDRGNVCAVGYLVEQDLGRDAVVAVARDYQFDYVPYIDSPALADWQATSGLSTLELTMIQPQYGEPDPPTSPPSINFWSGGGWTNEDLLLAGLLTSNLVTSIANFAYLSEGRGHVIGGWFGIFSGAASFIYGISAEEPAFTAAGVMAGAIGATSFGLAIAKGRDDEPSVSIAPTARPDDEGSVEFGVAADVHF